MCTFDAECGNPYGCALLARAYPAWFEKWMEGGAKRTLRLRMIKDAYIGDIFWYPTDRRFELADGREVSYRDLAKEITQTRHSGASLVLPLIRDSMGNKLLDYSPPQGVAGYTQISSGSRTWTWRFSGAGSAAGHDSGADERQRVQRQVDSILDRAVGGAPGAGGADSVHRSRHFAADRGAEFRARRAVSDSAAEFGGNLLRNVWAARAGEHSADAGAGECE